MGEEHPSILNEHPSMLDNTNDDLLHLKGAKEECRSYQMNETMSNLPLRALCVDYTQTMFLLGALAKEVGRRAPREFEGVEGVEQVIKHDIKKIPYVPQKEWRRRGERKGTSEGVDTFSVCILINDRSYFS